MDYLTVTKLTDPIEHRIPTGKAEEVAGEPTWLDAVDALICRELMNSAGDAVTNIPAAEAREVMPPTVVRMSLDEMLDGIFKPSIFERVKGKKMDQAKVDPNAAMIARDGAALSALPVVTVGYAEEAYVIADIQTSAWIHWEVVESSAKPAITGLTTVHDGKERGLGFCCE